MRNFNSLISLFAGFQRLEMLSYFACLSAMVNYIVFMTCYPACLSLILEVSIFDVIISYDYRLIMSSCRVLRTIMGR